MGKVRNALYIMCDQLRWDYLSCYGHPRLATPNIDALARRGIKFSNAYVQSPVCGPARMSSYTGRYVASHRSTWNFVPLPIDERTLGDYLRPAGVRVALSGKTHVEPDRAAMARCGIDPASERGLLLAEGGFEPFDRTDGVFPGDPSPLFQASPYGKYLAARGYGSGNAWHDWVNSAAGPNGEVLSGWRMRYARLPARIPEEHSETAYTTTRALEFIRAQGDRPWCLHLSYIKPHWPYVAPRPYHELYGPEDVPPAVRHERERAAHPVLASYMQHEESRAFARDEVRRTVIPTYMGLVKQIDDHVGRVTACLAETGRSDDTLIVFTSDHGDYLGDHFLGEKELFHDASARVPLIVCDPDPLADASRGRVRDELAEGIDVVPTLLDAFGLPIPEHLLEGRSLLPFTRGPAPAAWREIAVSELDYAFRSDTVARLNRSVRSCRAVMLRDERWKYVHFDGFGPQLFDLRDDPEELADRGEDPALAGVRARFHDRLFEWMRSRNPRVTTPDAAVEGCWDRIRAGGVAIGAW